MAAIAAAAAAAFAAVSSAVAATAAALAAYGTAISIGASMLGLSGVFSAAMTALKILSVASSIYSLVRKPRSSAGTPSPVAFKADPNAPITFVAGKAAVGGNIVMGQTHAPKNRFLTYVTALSHGGPVASVAPFTAADEVVTFTEDNGEGAAGRYRNRMWQKIGLGAVGAAALLMTSTANKYTPARAGPLTEWTPNHKLSGIAHSMLTMWSDTERFPNGVPKPLWVVHGGPVYDPRKDSTYPGGAGPQRWNDRTTWSLEGNENPHLHALSFLIGHTYNGIRFGGAGVPITGIDVAAFVQGANVCDANGWKISYPWSTAMRKWDVLATMLQAGGARPVARGAKISCVTQTPRVSIGEITDADLVGDFSVTGSQTRRDRINTVIPRLRMPSLKWTVQPYGRVTGAPYVAEDGGVRAREIEYEGVSGADGGKQGRQLAGYDLTGLREGLVATLPVSVKFLRLRAGDCITVNAPETLLNGQKVVVIKREFDPTSLIVTLTVQSETDGKHAFALGQTDAPPVTPALTGVDPLVLEPPAPTAWDLEPGLRPGGDTGGTGGTSRPAPVIRVTPGAGDYDGADDEPAAREVLIRYRIAGLSPDTGLPYQWSAPVAFTLSPDGYELTGLAPGVLYQVEIAYRARGVTSDWTDYGTVLTGALVATDVENVAGRPAADILTDLDAIPGIIDGAVSDLEDALDDLWATLETPTTGVIARLGSLTTAVEDLETGKASVTRVEALETTVNTPTTGLSARVASLITAVADLEAGKASVTRVDSLESRANTTDAKLRPGANLLPNPTGGNGLTGWNPSGTGGWITGNDARGSYFRRAFPGAAGLTASITSAVIPALAAGNVVTVSADYEQAGRTAGNTFIQMDFLNAGGAAIAGGSFARAFGNGAGAMVPFTGTAPAGTTSARIQIVLGGVSGDGTAALTVNRLKVELGSIATPFSDEASFNAPVVGLLARYTALDTLTTNLITGKADASRVTALEARAVGSNLLPKAQWSGSETTYAPWIYEETAVNFSPAVRSAAGGYSIPGEGSIQISQGGRNGADPNANVGQFSFAMPVEVGKRYSASAYTGAISSRCSVMMYFRNSAGGLVGSLIEDSNNKEKAGSNPSNINNLKRLAVFGTAPATAVEALILLRKYDTEGAATPESYAFFSRMMFGEVGPLATEAPPFSSAAVEARVTTQEAATADLMGRTQARWQVGAAVPGATAFIEAIAELTPGAAPTSSVAIGARQVAIYNVVNGTYAKALEVQNGNVVLSGGLTATGFIRLGNGVGWPLARATVPFSLTDGDVVTFGTDLGSIPIVTFERDNLAALAANETYSLVAESLTATGFTFRAKINIPATPTNQAITSADAAATVAGYSGRKQSRGALPDSADGTYRITATGSQNATIFGTGGGGPTAGNEQNVSTYLNVYALKGGAWTLVASTQAETVFDPDDYPSGPNFAAAFWAIDETFNVGTGATEIAVVQTGASNGEGAVVNDLTGLYWQSAGAGSGVRSATPAGQKTRVYVRPQ